MKHNYVQFIYICTCTPMGGRIKGAACGLNPIEPSRYGPACTNIVAQGQTKLKDSHTSSNAPKVGTYCQAG